MFLKEKCDGTLKSQECADRQLQREYTTKEEVSSPTVLLEAMVLSCAIDAKEGRYVFVMDIPGAFLHADMEDEVHILLEGTIADRIIKLEPSVYRKHIWYNQKGKPMLYVQLKRHYMVHYRQHFYFGNHYPIHYSSGASKSISMINVWQTELLKESNVPLYGTLTI